MRKSQTTTINIFWLFYRKIYIYSKIYFEKRSLYCYICISFFAGQVIGNAVIKHQRPYRYAMVVLRPRRLDNALGILT